MQQVERICQATGRQDQAGGERNSFDPGRPKYDCDGNKADCNYDPIVKCAAGVNAESLELVKRLKYGGAAR